MALSKDRLKEKIKDAFLSEQQETQDPDASINRLSDALAEAIVAEMKEITITYTAGLTANVPVVGTFGNTIS